MLKRKFFYWLTISNFLYIIVLLILAGVTISALSGDNGILTNASKAKISTELSNYKEEIELYKTQKAVENINFNPESLMAGKDKLTYNTQTERRNRKYNNDSNRHKWQMVWKSRSSKRKNDIKYSR